LGKPTASALDRGTARGRDAGGKGDVLCRDIGLWDRRKVSISIQIGPEESLNQETGEKA